MSTFYFNASIISRGRGQSAVASASYRSGEKLYSELDMETKSFRKRTVQPETFILAPSHAPEWVYNRERLWNEVEWHENKANSQLSREIKLALPIELDHDLQQKLLNEYVQENFVERGMVADVAIHRDVEHNPHAHIMLTVRPFNKDGTWGAKQRREYRKDENGNFILNNNGKKRPFKVELTDWNKKETLLEWRKRLAEKINHYYKENGIFEEVSHLSFEEQGLNKLPKHRLKRTEYQIEKREREKAVRQGIEYKPITTYAKFNFEIEKSNYELELLESRTVALKSQQSAIVDDIHIELNEIRKKGSLSSEDYKSLKVVAKRVNGYVNFKNARDNLMRLEYWKRKIENEKSVIVAEGKVLEKAKKIYMEQAKKVLMYGFVPSKFKEGFLTKSEKHKEKIDKYNQTVRAYNELYKHSKKVYDIQKVFTNEEFNFLYPQYADKFGENDSAMEIKFRYVDLFKSDGVIRHEIPEFETSTNKYSKKYEHLGMTLKAWNDTNKSLVILGKIKLKHQKEYANFYKEWDSEKVYSQTVIIARTKDQIAIKGVYKRILAEKLTEHMKELYPKTTEKTVENIPDSIKSKVLELHLKGGSTGKFSLDLRIVEMEKETVNHIDYEGQKQDSSSGTGELFSNLINSTKQAEGKYDVLERKRQQDKKRKHMKLYKSIDENELY